MKLLEKLKSWPKWLQWTVLTPIALVLLAVSCIGYAYVAATWASHGRIYEDVDTVPQVKVALVFGTTDRVDGQENLYFRYRMDAAAALWKAGRVQTLIVSGDNRTQYYNEPEKMRQALLKRGIPDERIVCDFAGLRTLDSVVRAKRIFNTNEVLFVSQRFHLERAIYLAKANGIEGYGFAAKDVNSSAGFKTRIREVGARVKMWLDVNFLDTKPRHLGDKVEMPE